MSELFLVAHKCHGEATFDVALRHVVDDEEMWITSAGHRVYPYWHAEIWDLLVCSKRSPRPFPLELPPVPEGAIECYRPRQAAEGRLGQSLLEELGLVQKIKRRV